MIIVTRPPALRIFAQLALQAHTEGSSRTLHLDDRIATTLALVKRRSDPSGHCLSLLNCLGALRAASEVVFYRLPFVAGEPVKEVIIQRFVC